MIRVWFVYGSFSVAMLKVKFDLSIKKCTFHYTYQEIKTLHFQSVYRKKAIGNIIIKGCDTDFILPFTLSDMGFLSINTFLCALNQGAHVYIPFSKNIFWEQIKISLVLKYDLHDTALFTKHKHIIFT
jgi:hypothetical protein